MDYIHEAERQLSNSTCYRKLTKDPTPDIIRELKKAVNLMYDNETIDKWTMRYLTPNHIRTAKFYLLPKIHKPGNPGRPIVSSMGSPTENISHFVDYHLRPLVTALPSHIQDTTHFLSKLLKLSCLPQNTLLVILDVTSLYTNIPHEEGTRACEEILDTRPSQDPPTKELCHLIHTILSNNSFMFNGSYYLQLQGTAMGTRMAPAYANIFMGKLEQDFLTTQPLQPLTWWRYIDDVFMVWTHGELGLNNFIRDLNNHHPTIKFTTHWSSARVEFLDTQVSVVNGNIKTDLHIKPTATHQYLHATSCHPHHNKSFIPYSQALRLRRICSDDSDLQIRIEKLQFYLEQRGYKKEALTPQLERVRAKPREDCLLPTAKKQQDPQIPLVVTYAPTLPSLGKITRQHHHILHLSERTKQAFPQPPTIAYRRPKN